MAFRKKVWKDRLVEFAGRRKLTRVAGSIEDQIIVDVARDEGAVSQQGDAFSEANMNDLENRIEEGFDDTIDRNNILDKEEVEANTEAGKYVADALVVKDLNDSLQGFTPVVDETTGEITGYKTKVGADTVFPFRRSGNVYFKLGTRCDFTEVIQSLGKNVSDFTASNFKAVINSATGSANINVNPGTAGNATTNANSMTSNYNNGVITFTEASSFGRNIGGGALLTANISVPIIGILFDPSDNPFSE